MNAWLAIFRAEFRRAAYLLPWVIVLHLLMFCVRSGKGPQISPRLASLTEWGTVVLAGLIVIPSLWADSPSRLERFLATRPAKPLLLHSAKLAALFVLAGLPFIAVEFFTLLRWAWPDRIVVLGTLQAVLAVVVVLLSACPLVWLWRGKIAGTIGSLLMLVVASWTVSIAARKLYASSGTPWLAAAKFSYPPVQLLTLAITALLIACLFAIPGKLRSRAKILLFLPATCLSVLMVMWTCNRRPSPDQGETVPLVQLYLDRHSERDAETLGVTLPAPVAPPDVEVEWDLTKLLANARDFTPWPTQVIGGNDQYGLQSPAIQKALRLRYGAGLQLPEPEATERIRWPNHTLVSARDSGGKLELDLTARRNLIGFEVAAELPFQIGASSRQGDLLWSIEKYSDPELDAKRGDQARFSLRSPFVWLGSLEPEADTIYRFFILYADGRIKRLRHWLQGPTSARGKGGVHSIGIPLFEELRIIGDDNWPAGARLVILRPALLSRSSYSWKSPGSVATRSGRGSRYPKVPDPGPNAILPWLKDHPTPAATASGEEVFDWLSELLLRIRLTPPRDNSDDPAFQAAIDEVAKLVPSHPDRVHQALEDLPDTRNGAQNVCWDAFEKSLQRDAVARFPELMEDPVIRYQYARKGWAKDVLPYEVKRARLGFEPNMTSLLLESPEATGFSQAEWLAIFRLDPSSQVFRSLNGRVIPKPLLEEEADRLIAGYFPYASTWKFRSHPALIDLALARGRGEAPAWLAEWLPRWRDAGASNPRGIGFMLAHSFALPDSANTDKAAIEWFLAQDPAAFRFDPVSGKYQLP